MRHLFIILVLFTFKLSAQDAELTFRKFDLGANFGLNISNVLAQSDDTLFSEDFKPRFTGHIGIKLIYNPTAFFSIRSGFTFNARGYKEDVPPPPGFGNSSELEFIFSALYIDIPLVVQANLTPKVEQGGIFLRGGGYYGFAVGGGTRLKNKSDDPIRTTGPQNLSIGNSATDDIRKGDYGLTLGGGLSFVSFEIAAMWDIGLANISNDNSNGFYAKNRLFRLDLVIFAL